MHAVNYLLTYDYRGTRSLPSCLGGGDLDGDEYNLILDVSLPRISSMQNVHSADVAQPNLHPPNTATPAEYKGLPNRKTEHPCTVADVADFVMNYVRIIISESSSHY